MRHNKYLSGFCYHLAAAETEKWAKVIKFARKNGRQAQKTLDQSSSPTYSRF
jgi:hypothetical protein